MKPTHTCFDDALDYLEALVKDHPHLAHESEIKLVHAIVLTPDDEPYSHAWVETDEDIVEMVLDEGERKLIYFNRAMYYEARRPQKLTRYTIKEAAAQNAIHETFGPWEEEYIALCRDKKKKNESLPQT